MVISGIDFGEVHTGVSLCDKNELLAYPLCTIQESNIGSLICKIIEKIEENCVELIVLGYPLNMDGTAGEKAKKVENFRQKLAEKLKLEIILWDERLTTVNAKKNFRIINKKEKKCKKIIDAAASCLILQNYLDYRRLTNKD